MFQINQQNRKETEDQIRCALQSLMKPEEVEDELRKAIEGTVYILGQQSISLCFLLTVLNQGILLKGIHHWLGAAYYLVQGS